MAVPRLPRLLWLLDSHTRIAACFNLTGSEMVNDFIGTDHRPVIVRMQGRDLHFDISGDQDGIVCPSHAVCRELNQLLLRHCRELLPLFSPLLCCESSKVVCK